MSACLADVQWLADRDNTSLLLLYHSAQLASNLAFAESLSPDQFTVQGAIYYFDCCTNSTSAQRDDTAHSALQLLPWTPRTVAWAATLDPASPWDAGTMGTVSTLANVATMLTGMQRPGLFSI